MFSYTLLPHRILVILANHLSHNSLYYAAIPFFISYPSPCDRGTPLYHHVTKHRPLLAFYHRVTGYIPLSPRDQAFPSITMRPGTPLITMWPGKSFHHHVTGTLQSPCDQHQHTRLQLLAFLWICACGILLLIISANISPGSTLHRTNHF